MRRFAIAIVLLAGCRTRAVTTHYAGAPVAACAAGRPYDAPPINSPKQPFIPLVAATAPAPAAVPEPTAPAAGGGGDSDAATDDAAEKPDKTAKKPAKPKKPKKPAKKKKEAP